jgi:hypothetical protein
MKENKPRISLVSCLHELTKPDNWLGVYLRYSKLKGVRKTKAYQGQKQTSFHSPRFDPYIADLTRATILTKELLF